MVLTHGLHRRQHTTAEVYVNRRRCTACICLGKSAFLSASHGFVCVALSLWRSSLERKVIVFVYRIFHSVSRTRQACNRCCLLRNIPIYCNVACVSIGPFRHQSFTIDGRNLQEEEANDDNYMKAYRNKPLYVTSKCNQRRSKTQHCNIELEFVYSRNAHNNVLAVGLRGRGGGGTPTPVLGKVLSSSHVCP